MPEFDQLRESILHPVRSELPEAREFERNLERFAILLEQRAPGMPEEELAELAALKDVNREIVYYLEGDPLYDAGHDVVSADYSRIRRVATGELERRAVRARPSTR